MGEAAAVVGKIYVASSTAAAADTITMVVVVVASDLRKPRSGARAVRQAHPQAG